MKVNYFLLAGEVSGDLHGSLLIQALQQRSPSSSFYGVGGPRMREAGLQCEIPMEGFQVMGFSDVLMNFPRLWQLFHQVKRMILKSKPDCLILIDYPGLNLRLAKALRRQGFKGKIVQYICPSVWAHGKKRIDTLNRYFDLLLTIYPFENSYFSSSSLKVAYIGNPIAETIQTHPYCSDWRNRLNLPPCDFIGLFPGSRPGEINRHLSDQLQSAFLLKQSNPHLVAALSSAHHTLDKDLAACVRQSPLKLGEDLFIVPQTYRYELMKECRIALSKSGTVTLELALHAVPTLVHYRLTWLNEWIAKYLLRLNLPHYCIVNILGNQPIFPEFIQSRGSVKEFKNILERLHTDEKLRKKIKDGCKLIGDQLGNGSSIEKAAKAIIELNHV